MTTYKELKEKFDQDVKELQTNCKHNETKWVRQSFGFGHFTGYEIEICIICHKELGKRKEKR